MKSQHFTVKGMTCSNCALGVKKSIEKNGGHSAQVDFATGETNFYLDDESKINSITKDIESKGYEVSIEDTPEDEGWSKSEKLFAFCLIFTLPLFAHMFVGHNHFLNNPFLQIGLILPILFTGGWFFVKSAVASLKAGVPNMDVLISVGIIAAFGYSLAGVITHYGTPEMHNFLFFETAATITTLVLLGNVMEHRAIKKTTSAIQELKKLQPSKVSLWKDGDWIEVDANEIEVNNQVKVVDGDAVPFDGIVLKGELEVDESMLTGESEPIYKKSGDELLSGTTILSGNASYKVKSLLKDSALSQIIKLVSSAQSNKPDIQKLGDKISAIFVPIVLGISLLTFLLSYLIFGIELEQSLMQSIAVLVISCPCAMGLAAPTAIMVGVGKAAKSGAIIKGGTTLENLSKVNAVIFDKTGTLTTGNFVLEKLQTYDISENEVKKIIVSLEQHSKHPIALSLYNTLKNEVAIEALENVKEIKGKGMEGDYEGKKYQLISSKYAKNHGINTKADLLLMQEEDKVAELWIKDDIKKDASKTIAWLKENGITPILLSGDRKEKCEYVANKLGIEQFYYEQSPEQKLNWVHEINRKQKALMLGDGVNDGPSLAASFLGVSFGAASGVAVNASDVVLMNSQLMTLTKAIEVGQKTYRTVKQNFFWAFFYNVIAIPIAAFGFLIPIYAALAMAFSDVIVVGNSIRLKYK